MFLAVATDNGLMPRSSQARISIDVTDAAHHFPVWQPFTNCPAEVTKDENVLVCIENFFHKFFILLFKLNCKC